jgi:hypothetical protein
MSKNELKKEKSNVYYPISSEGKMTFWEWVRAEIPYTMDIEELSKLTKEKWDSFVQFVIERLDESIPDWFEEWAEENLEDEEDGEDE